MERAEVTVIELLYEHLLEKYPKRAKLVIKPDAEKHIVFYEAGGEYYMGCHKRVRRKDKWALSPDYVTIYYVPNGHSHYDARLIADVNMHDPEFISKIEAVLENIP